jgi:tetratricopeptide (TPR) repeat protein
LNKAFAIVEPLEKDSSIPQWLYYGRLGELYAAAGKWDQMIPAAEHALQLAPDNATLLLDLALNIIYHDRDALRAKALLAEARTHAISDLLVPFVDELEGLIALEEGRLAEAQKLLSRALHSLNAKLASQPVFAPSVASLHGYLAIACARLGDAQAAEDHFAKAEPRLRARKLQPLIDRIEQALRQPEVVDSPAVG